MQNLISSRQIKEADAFTMRSRGISTVALMESASAAFVAAFKTEVSNPDTRINVYCGTGNNGGDGLAIARLLKDGGYSRISVTVAKFQSAESEGFLANLSRLRDSGIPIIEITSLSSLPAETADVIIDAIVGSGLNKSLQSPIAEVINYINSLNKKVVAVDLPSGFPAEGPIDPGASVLKADLTISFQRPKLNFFFPESKIATERWRVVEIGLDEDFIQSQQVTCKLIEPADISHLLKTRPPFSHKGSYGHALIVAGDTSTMGAALLCADACLHSGAGLTTASIPDSGLTALNSYCPEVMFLSRSGLTASDLQEKYSSIAIGPGLGTNSVTESLLRNLTAYHIPMVLDADALNILATHPDLLTSLPINSVLCPHMKEFDRLFGESGSWWERVEKAKLKSAELQLVIILKNQYTFIILPEGHVLINQTGNPAMAVGGMGDVLTGMIAAFICQGYSAVEAAILGVFLHGKAGDELAAMNSIPPRYIISRLPYVIKSSRLGGGLN